jgi:ferrous-iron efflux pump FieF
MENAVPKYDMQQAGLRIRLTSALAVVVALCLIAMKAYAWIVTGSVALLGSLLDSVLDFSISFINFFAVRHALMPADNEHRFGHGKAEALAALGQGMIIALSACFLAWRSVESFMDPQPLAHGAVGIVVICISIALTLLLVLVQRRVAAQTGSLAIAADSAHYEGDLYMNVAVIGAILLADFAALPIADPVLGLVVTVILLRSSQSILVKAGKQLMDHEVNDQTRDKIRDIITAHKDVLAMHDLRTRRSGTQLFIQCHIELDGSMSLNRAHRISDEVEMNLLEAFPAADILIHQDPEGHEDISELELS